MRKALVFLAIAALLLGFCYLAQAQAPAEAPKGGPPGPSAPLPATWPRMMMEAAYTSLSRGYDLFRDGKYDAAEAEFKAALKADRCNPFALNNLAALTERQGKMQEAMAYLTDAQVHAAEYMDELEQTCFPGGLCAATKPVRQLGPTSMIATVVADNIAKLKEKMGKKK